MRDLIKRNLAMTATLLLAVMVQLGQIAPLKYGDIITALSARLPAGMTKQQLVENLIQDVKKRGVDRPLTPDIEDLLRQAGATNDLMITIRQNAPQGGGVGSLTTRKGNSEEVFWESIENSDDATDFEDYFYRITRGEFAGTFRAVAEVKLLRIMSSKSKAGWSHLRAIASNLAKYDKVYGFFDGLALAINADGTRIYVDKLGHEAFQSQFSGAGSFHQGLAVTSNREGKQGYIDLTGKVVISHRFEWALPFYENLARVKANDRWGFIDRSGRVVVPIEYRGGFRSERLGSFSEGLAPLANGDERYGFVNRLGRVVIPFIYTDAEMFSEGLAPVSVGTGEAVRWGYIDMAGRQVIAPKYLRAFAFAEGLASVAFGERYNTKYGFIDKSGEIVIRPIYDYAWGFSNGFAAVQLNKKWGFIDSAGNPSIPIKYDEVGIDHQGDLAFVTLGNKTGFVNKYGRESLFDSVWCYALMDKGYIGVWLNGKKGFADLYGNFFLTDSGGR